MTLPTRTSFLTLVLAAPAISLSPSLANAQLQATPPPAHTRSAGGDIGSGAGNIGKGTAQAGGNVAKGAGNLVTLHPVGAGKDLGKGGKDLGVGAVKGTGKIAKGTGRGIGHLFHHSHKQPPSSSGPPSD